VPYVELSGRNFYFEENGEGEPLLAIAGLGCTVESWLPIIVSLCTRYRVICFDNRDVGRSWKTEGPYTPADMASDSLELATALDVTEMHVLGHSMGSIIAQEVALAAPQRIKTLTLMGTWSGGSRWWSKWVDKWARDRQMYPLEEFVRTNMPHLFAPAFYDDEKTIEDIVRWTLDFPHPQSVEAYVRQCGACAAHDTRGRLSAINTPTHVIGAELDTVVPVWGARETAAEIQGSRFTLIQGSGHSMATEKSAETSDAILRFLDRR
jgi:3-oxoadipate enol-lactonase